MLKTLKSKKRTPAGSRLPSSRSLGELPQVPAAPRLSPSPSSADVPQMFLPEIEGNANLVESIANPVGRSFQPAPLQASFSEPIFPAPRTILHMFESQSQPELEPLPQLSSLSLDNVNQPSSLVEKKSATPSKPC